MTLTSTPLTLKCGVTIPNRLTKAALSELLADPVRNSATQELVNLYEHWGKCGFGIIITGNIFTQREYVESPYALVVDDSYPEQIPVLRQIAKVGKQRGSILIAQLSHSGRQTSFAITTKPVAPSACPSVAGFPFNLIFGKPRALTVEEITTIIKQFGRTSQILQECGFDGVQLHSAHGYLLSQFLSPITNFRTDHYGGSLRKRCNFLKEIVETIRKLCGERFVISVKLNSSDFVKGGFNTDDALEVAKLLEEIGVDFIEFSGGTYENTIFLSGPGVKQREAFFLSFTKEIREAVKTPLCVTGGFRTLAFMNECLDSNRVDLIGLGRPACIDSAQIADLLEPDQGAKLNEVEIQTPLANLTGGFSYFWHQRQISRLAHKLLPDLSLWIAPTIITHAIPMYLWHPARSSFGNYVAIVVILLLLYVFFV